ncbi:MAG: 2-hydroxychromene-2-carboxylate isomerase [Tepidamorphaceae bacterium]
MSVDAQASRARIEFWFDFASTYSYLTAMRIDEAAKAAGVTVTWRPFLLGPIFSGQGWNTSPFNLYPAKGRYMWRDMERMTRERGLPLVQPDPFPQNSLLAARTGLAVRKSNAAKLPAFCKALFTAQFGDGRDISDTQTLMDAVSAAGLDPKVTLEQTITPEIKAELRNETEQAQGIGIFGAPTFVTSYGELFWGDDRLDQALEWATRVSR